MPPVTGSVTPVMNPASSESRNAMAGTTSSGVALRPMGLSAAAACTIRSGVSLRKFVSIMLGATQFTVTPNLAYSTARLLTSPPMALLAIT